MLNCKTCKHWKIVKASFLLWGVCLFVSYPVGKGAHMVDYSTECACNDIEVIELETNENFGCVLHEEKGSHADERRSG